MQLVKLVVPKHLYDELKLHPNQTIMLSNSEVIGKPGIHGTNVAATFNSEETSSQHHKPLLVEPEIYNDWSANESSLESSDASVLTLVVNVSYGIQKILTYHLNSIQIVSNVQSGVDTGEPESSFNNSDETASSITDLNSVICEPHTQDNSKSSHSEHETISGETDTHYNNGSVPVISPSHHNELLRSEPAANEENFVGESIMDIFTGSFLEDVNAESGEQELQTYNVNSTSCMSNEQSELENTTKESDDENASTKENNSIICDSLALKLSESIKTSEILPSSKKLDVPPKIPTEGGSSNIGKTRMEDKNGTVNSVHCPDCDRVYKSSETLRKHKKNCASMRAKKINYPRCCAHCKRFYRSKRSFSNHKNRCIGNKKNGPIQSRISQKTVLKSKIALDAKCIVKNSHPIICPVCSQSFLNKVSFLHHELFCVKKKAREDPDSGVLKKPGEWIPVKIDSKRALKYFVKQKTTPASNEN